MVKTQCPHCDNVIEAEGFPKGKPFTCPSCQRMFLPTVLQDVASSPAARPAAPAKPEVAKPAAAPPPRPSSSSPSIFQKAPAKPVSAPAPPSSPAASVPPARPSSAASSAPVPAAVKATREVAAGPQRVKVVACTKCRALLRLGAGESKFGKCSACSHVFVYDEKTVTELVLPASELAELPTLELFAAALHDESPNDGAATLMRTSAKAAPPPPREKVRCMLVSDSARVRFELDKDVVLIGRVGADLTLNDPDVSRRHATVEQSAGKVIVRDLKSTNGTFVNGVRIELEVLKDGDRIRVGSTELRLVITSEGEREKHAALFADLGPGLSPADVRQALDTLNRWAVEELKEWTPDVILSPSTGRAMIIWRFNSTLSADERRRLLTRFVMAPASLRLELQTVPLPSGAPLQPLLGLVLGLAKRDVAGGRAKYEGPLMQKAGLAVKVPGRDASFISDIESLELLIGERGSEAIATKLHEMRLRALPAGEGHPFVLVQTTEGLKEGMAAAKQGATGAGRPLRLVASTVEAELLDLLQEKCGRDFAAGLAMTFSSANKPSGVFRKLTGGKANEDFKLKTRFYESILRGSVIFLGKDDVVRWMELLRDIGMRYPDALKAERERMGADAGGPGWDDLKALGDEQLLAASEAAILFRAAFFKGQSIVGADLRQLARSCSEALAASVPPKYGPVPLPILERVYGIFRDAVDVPSNQVEGRGLFEFFVLLALAGVTESIGSEALRRAQHYGDEDEVRAVKDNYGAQLQILKQGLATMSRIVGVLKLRPPLRTVAAAKSLFDRYQLPAYGLIP